MKSGQAQFPNKLEGQLSRTICLTIDRDSYNICCRSTEVNRPFEMDCKNEYKRFNSWQYVSVQVFSKATLCFFPFRDECTAQSGRLGQ